MFYSTQKIIQAIESGRAVDFLFFWGHRPRKDGGIGKSCLSQWYASGFSFDGEYFPTAEHWMMAGKARLFGDEPIRQHILKAASPLEAKRLGRKVKGFEQDKWSNAAQELVIEGNYLKFSQSKRLQSFLLSTGDQVLVEAAPNDAIWGIGMVAEDPRANDPTQWMGTNWLGFALMEVRDRLK